MGALSFWFFFLELIPLGAMFFLYRWGSFSGKRLLLQVCLVGVLPMCLYARWGAYDRLRLVEEYATLQQRFEQAVQQEQYETAFGLLQNIVQLLQKD